MTTPLPFDVFSSELLPGETVQWTGRPNAAVILHKEDWGTIPFSLLWGGFAIFWLLGASGIGNFWTNRPDKFSSRSVCCTSVDCFGADSFSLFTAGMACKARSAHGIRGRAANRIHTKRRSRPKHPYDNRGRFGSISSDWRGPDGKDPVAVGGYRSRL